MQEEEFRGTDDYKFCTGGPCAACKAVRGYSFQPDCRAHSSTSLFLAIIAVASSLSAASQRPQSECRSVPSTEPLFTEVVRAVNQITGRWRLTSSLDLNKRFPPANRAANWQALEEALEITLPKLEDSADSTAPRISERYTSVIALTYWIAEQHPERGDLKLIEPSVVKPIDV